MDEPHLEHRGIKRAGAGDVVDLLGLTQKLSDLAAIVAREVRAHSLTQVRGLAHIQRSAAGVTEEVDAGPAGQAIGEPQLRRLRMAVDAGEREQVVEAEHAERGRALEQEVQQVSGGERVVERPVRGLVRQAESGGQRRQPAVRHLVSHQPASERARVDPRVRHRGPARSAAGRGEEREIEPDVVTDDDRSGTELLERGQHRLDARCRQHHRLRDAGEHRDLRRNRHTGVHERLERAEELAAAHLDRADLGDTAPIGRAARRLEIDDAERHL